MGDIPEARCIKGLFSRILASSKSFVSVLWIPWVVFKRTGQKLPMKITAVFEDSWMPSHKIKSGIHASIGTGRRIFTREPKIRLQVLEKPMMPPRIIPATAPREKPRSTLWILMSRSSAILPLLQRSAAVANTVLGDGRMLALTSPNSEAMNQAASTAAGAMTARK